LALTAERNNRILAAMKEGGATLRQGIANKGARDVAQIRQAGATTRAGMAERGAGERTELHAETMRAGQETSREIAQEGEAGADRRQAAEIQSRRESDDFRRETDRLTEMLREEHAVARENRIEGRATKDIERYDKWRAEELKLSKAGLITQLSMGASQLRMMMGLIDKQFGAETAAQRKLAAINQMEATYQAKAQGRGGLTTQVKNYLAEHPALEDLAVQQPAAFGQMGQIADRALYELTTKLQTPVTMELLTSDGKVDELEQRAAEWGMDGHFKVMEALEGIQGHLQGELERITKGKEGPIVETPMRGLAGVVPGKTYKTRGSTAEGQAYLENQLDRVQKALDRMEILKNSSRDIGNGLTLGSQVQAWEMNRQGASMDAIAHQLKMQFGDDVDGMGGALEEIYRDAFDPAMTAVPEHLLATFDDPDAVALANQIMQTMYGAIPGVRRDVATVPEYNPLDFFGNPDTRPAGMQIEQLLGVGP
jgi:phage-related protein